MLPPAIVAGYQFPLLIALFGRGRERLGRDVGLAYAANTAGAIAGSLAGGFGVLPWLSAPGAWRLCAVLLLALGAAAVVLSSIARTRSRRRQRYDEPRASYAAVAFRYAGGRAAAGDRSCCSARRGRPRSGATAASAPAARPVDVLTAPNQLRDWSQRMKRAIVWDGDGIESSVALALEQTGYAFIVNGKSDGSARGDAGTQVMLGLLGAIGQSAAAARAGDRPRHRQHRRLARRRSPSMERVDVVELEPLVVDVARACAT